MTSEGGENRQIVHEKVKTPWGFSDRSLILCYNLIGDVHDESRNRFEMVTSSKGNEKYYEEYKKSLDDDVIADCNIDYWRIEKFTEEGKEKVRVFNLNHFSINGSIPGFVVNAISTMCGKPVERLCNSMQAHEKEYTAYLA